MIKGDSKWRPVQLPRKIVDKVETIANDTSSDYRSISDFIITALREKFEKIQNLEDSKK